MKKNILLLLLLTSGFGLMNGQSGLPSFVKDSLDAYIQRGMADWQIPGLAAAIVKDGKIIFMKGYGVTQLDGKEKVDENTLFMIGSNTKAFTSTALTILEQEKKLSLQDKVVKWMPEFQLANQNITQEVTIEDLLCHRLGFETFQGDFTYWTSNLSRDEVIRKMAKVKAPYDFRTRWGYCNAAFLAAGEIIPRVTGLSWQETVKKKILEPLQMSRTLMLSEELPKAGNVAKPHSLAPNGQLAALPFVNIDNLAPAGSMSSSVQDMCKWIMLQLNLGKLEDRQIIPKQAIEATRIPKSFLGINLGTKKETHFTTYGLGLGISDRNKRVVLSHTGGVDGYLSSVMLIPEENLGFVILTNTDQNSFFQTMTFELRDVFLGLPYQAFSYHALQEQMSSRIREKALQDSLRQLINLKRNPPVALSNFTGRYSNELYGDITLQLENGLLNIHFSNHPGLIGKLEYLQGNTFLCTYSNPTMGVKEIPFKIDYGKVQGLTLTVADFVEFTAYEFIKQEDSREDRTRTDWAWLKRFQMDNQQLPAPKPGEKRVVFMGNSITQGWLRLNPAFFEGRPYINRGISGQTTPQMLLRFRQDVLDLKPAVVVILAGTNDIAGNTGPMTLDESMDNITSMAELAKANGIEVVLCSVLPAYDFPWRPGLQPAPKIVQLNAMIKQYAQQNGLAYVNYHSALSDERNGLKKAYSGDGVHPNLAGYKVMEPLVEKAIQGILK